MKVDQNAVGDTVRSDVVDLYELLSELWQRKIFISLIVLLCATLAAAYAFISPQVYEATAVAHPPDISALMEYNATVAPLSATADTESTLTLTEAEAFDVFLAHLSSDAVRDIFFRTYYLPSYGVALDDAATEKARAALNHNLTIVFPTGVGSGPARVVLRGESPHKVGRWVGHFMDIAIAEAQKQLSARIASGVAYHRKAIEDKIHTARELARRHRADYIARLQDALALAQTLELESLPPSSPLVLVDGAGSSDGNVFEYHSLVYLRGSLAITAELAQLEQRKSDDAYITTLPALLISQMQMNAIEPHGTNVGVATVNPYADAPGYPIKSGKLITVLRGAVLGVVLAMLFVVTHHLFRRRQSVES